MEVDQPDILALDVGSKRIGVARANSVARIPEALATIQVDGSELDTITKLVKKHKVHVIVVGWPRNISGEETAQTRTVEKFIQQLSGLGCTIVRQDETLTSVQAEDELAQTSRTVQKGDIDARAAQLILEDYLRDTA